MIKVWAFALSVIFFLTACVSTPPSDEGAALYRAGDYAAAYHALSPLARENDVRAQALIAIMALRNLAGSDLANDVVRTYLTAAARAGDDEAMAWALWLNASDMDRARFQETDRLHRSADAAGDDSARLREWLSFSRTAQYADDWTNGPLSPGVSAALIVLARSSARAPVRDFQIPNDELAAIDLERAKSGRKHAQARIGARYAAGRGVRRDAREAFRWRLKAAKTTAAQNNCVYQAPVGNAAGSVYCYETGASKAGLASAMLEVCRAYAVGVGVEKNIRKARKWCLRAQNDPLYTKEARTILSTFPEN